jgi:DNA topoisomerase-3
VQTPTLALVVNRERDIRAFTPAPYWEVWATFKKDSGETYWGKWSKGKDRLENRSEAQSAWAARGKSSG